MLASCSESNNYSFKALHTRDNISPRDTFSTGLISQQKRFEQNITFSTDGKLCIVGLSDSTWNYKGLLQYKYSDNKWKLTDTINLGFDFIGEAMFAPTADNLFFIAFVPKEGMGFQTDIYLSEFKDGEYQKAVRVAGLINTDNNDSDPLIAPDEGYLIVQSDRQGGFDKHDFFCELQ